MNTNTTVKTRWKSSVVGRVAPLLATALLGPACYGDLVSTRGDEADAGADPGGSGAPGGGSGADAAPIPEDVELVCADAQTPPGDGYHYPGMACGGCHNGSVGPAFAVGGTLYADPGGGAPVAGVTITLIDADGNRIDIVSAENGNFWSDQPAAFPVTAYASSCPDVVPMMTLAEAGDCNTCHAAGAAITFAP
jgi:hypothetical protein